jgi:hypothetical protein
MIDAALAHRLIGIILALRLLDADCEENFECGVGPDAKQCRKGPGIEARFLEAGIDARARTVRPGIAKTPERRERRWRRGTLLLWMRRQPLPALLAPALMRGIDAPAYVGMQITPL